MIGLESSRNRDIHAHALVDPLSNGDTLDARPEVVACCVWSRLELTVRRRSLVREPKEVNVTTGTIKKLVSDRGFGFITAEDGKDYFFHRDGLSQSLDFDRLIGGEKVSFEIEPSPKGARAKNIQPA